MSHCNTTSKYDSLPLVILDIVSQQDSGKQSWGPFTVFINKSFSTNRVKIVGACALENVVSEYWV